MSEKLDALHGVIQPVKPQDGARSRQPGMEDRSFADLLAEADRVQDRVRVGRGGNGNAGRIPDPAPRAGTVPHWWGPAWASLAPLLGGVLPHSRTREPEPPEDREG